MHRPLHETAFPAIVACAVLLATFTSPVLASSLGHASLSASQDRSQASTPAEPNNSTVRHEDPQRVSDEGNAKQVQAYLISKLSDQLGSSSVQLSQGQYRQARSLVGDEYSGNLEKLVEVSGQVEGSEGERAAKELEQAKKQQQSFATSVQKYRRTYEKYQRAKRNGNDERARKLAHRLERISKNASQSGNNLQGSLGEIQNNTGANLTQPRANVEEEQGNISNQQKEIRADEFEETELTVSANDTDVSFTEPLEIDGQLATVDGTAVANEEITLRVGNQTLETETDDDGTFSVTYRPTMLSLRTENLTVRYVPADTSAYLGSNATLSVDVRQTNASLVMTEADKRAKYNRTLEAVGEVNVDGVPARNASVRITLGGVPLGTVRTDEDGQFSLEERIPVNVSNGRQPFRAEIARTNRAITAEPAANRTVFVTPTRTNLTLSARRVSNDTVLVSGNLTTADGTPVPNRSVDIRIGGRTLTTVKTDRKGSYEQTIALQRETRTKRRTVAIIGAFDGKGTALESAKARDQVTLPAIAPEESWLKRYGAFIAGGILFITALAGAIVLLRQEVTTVADGTGSTDRRSTSKSADDRKASLVFLTAAREYLAQGETDSAVRSAHAAIRRWMKDAYGVADARTHWEFYRAVCDLGHDSNGDELGRLTQAYEQAAFDRRSTDERTAEKAVDTASEFVEANDYEPTRTK